MTIADYYQHVSFCIDAPLDAARWIKDRIETRDENDDSLSGVSVELQPVKLDDRREAWIHDYDVYPNINVVAGVLAEAQEKFKLDDVWSFEWSNDCTKPLLDAYGGGAVVVADGEVRWMTTGDWVARHEGVVKTRRREEEEAAERRAQLNGKGRR